MRDEGGKNPQRETGCLEVEVKRWSQTPEFMACVQRCLVAPLPDQRLWGKGQVRSRGDDSV